MKTKVALSSLMTATAASLMFTSSSDAASINQSVQFQLNSSSYSDASGEHLLATAPFELHGHSMVPLREMAVSLGSNIAWNQTNQTATLSGPPFEEIKLTVNSDIAVHAQGESIQLPERVRLEKGSVFVPVRSVAVLMKAQLKWDSASRTITVSKDTDQADPIHVSFDLNKDEQGWQGGFSDLPVNYNPDIYNLDYAREHIPDQSEPKYGLKLKGNNRSDDLFMYLTRGIGGLTPNTTYDVKMKFTLYTEQEAGAGGVGGAPAESVFVKAGIVNKEPKAVKEEVEGNPYYRMNVDIGSQSNSGKDAKVIGDIRKPDPDREGFQRVDFDYNATVTSNAKGEMYLLIGTDSGFEGLTTLYYSDIEVTAAPK